MQTKNTCGMVRIPTAREAANGRILICFMKWGSGRLLFFMNGKRIRRNKADGFIAVLLQNDSRWERQGKLK
jgi:hypothetical protein